MDDLSDSPIANAFNCLEYQPIEDEVRVRPGTQESFKHQVYRIIDERLRINVHDHRITHDEIAEAITDKVIEIKGSGESHYCVSIDRQN